MQENLKYIQYILRILYKKLYIAGDKTILNANIIGLLYIGLIGL